MCGSDVILYFWILEPKNEDHLQEDLNGKIEEEASQKTTKSTKEGWLFSSLLVCLILMYKFIDNNLIKIEEPANRDVEQSVRELNNTSDSASFDFECGVGKWLKISLANGIWIECWD